MTSAQPEGEVNRRPEDGNSTELAKTSFDYFKHFTTLGATAALGVVTLKDVANVANGFVVFSVLSFVASMLVSFRGMNRHLTILHTDPHMWETNAVMRTVSLTRRVQVFFLSGIGFFVMGALWESSVWYVVPIAAILLLGYTLLVVTLSYWNP